MSAIQAVSLFLVISAAFLSPAVSNLFRIPVACTEIVLGIIIGHSLLNIVSVSKWLEFLADFGFFVLMFSVGLEIELKNINIKLFLINVLAFIVNIMISLLFVHVLSLDFIWVAILSSVSVGVTVSVLKESELIRKKAGMIILYSGIIQELIMLALATVYELYHVGGYSFVQTVELIISIILALSFFNLVNLFHWWYPEKFRYLILSDDPFKSSARFAFTVMFLSISFAFYFNVDPVIGAFIAGFILSAALNDVEKIKEYMDTIGYGFFIPVFFVYTGINIVINLRSLPFIFLIAVVMGLAHIGNILVFIYYHFSIKESFVYAVNISKGLSIVVLIVTIARSLQLINDAVFSDAIVAALIAEIFYSTLFNAGYKRIK